MVVLQLIVFAHAQRVKKIVMPQQGQWHLKIKCTSCNEMFPKQVTVSLKQKVQVIKQVVNFQIKCKNCSRKSTILILQKQSPYSVQADQNGNIKGGIVCFDCRGLQIMEVNVGNCFNVETQSGTLYQSADFTDVWAQFDQKLGQLCQIEDIKVEIVRK